MDLYNANAANSLHHQDARHFEQQLERNRIATERAAERAAEFAATRTETPAVNRRRIISLSAIFRTRSRTAQ